MINTQDLEIKVKSLTNELLKIIEDVKDKSKLINIRTSKEFPERSEDEYSFRIFYDKKIIEGLTTSLSELIYSPANDVYEVLKEDFEKVSKKDALNTIKNQLLEYSK